MTVNEPGLLEFNVLGTHSLLSGLQYGDYIEVRRRNRAHGLDWYTEFYALFQNIEYRAKPYDVAKITCPGILHLLTHRTVLYPKYIANLSAFDVVKGETVMKRIVNFNAGASATTGNGRLRNGAISTFSVETDLARGNTIDYECAYKNVLSAVQEVAVLAGADFNIVSTTPGQWQFRYYPGQLGTDRTSTVLFSLERDNIINPVLTVDRSTLATVAVAVGEGVGSDRISRVETSSEFPGIDIELYVDAGDRNTQTSLQNKAKSALDTTKTSTTLQFKPRQVPSSIYGVHYKLGDKVKARYKGFTITPKVQSITVRISENGEETIDGEIY